MSATIKIELSLDNLIEAISSLDFAEKCQLKEIIDQQIFAIEEDFYEDSPETIAELELVNKEYEQKEYLTLDDFWVKNSRELIVNYQIIISKIVQKQIEILPDNIKKRVIDKLKNLSQNPRPENSIKLKGYDQEYRVRIGDY
jgi:mRNA interferase RelE/StbE